MYYIECIIYRHKPEKFYEFWVSDFGVLSSFSGEGIKHDNNNYTHNLIEEMMMMR